MAHMIDETTGKAAIAYVGDTPWHTLGKRKNPGDSLESWAHDAGIAFDVESAPVLFDVGGRSAGFQNMPGRRVLYRTDTPC